MRTDGRAVALEDKCAHRYAPLSKGALIGDTLRCGYHGLCYDTTGKCVQIPGPGPHPVEGARARLSRRRAPPPRLDLDGRSRSAPISRGSRTCTGSTTRPGSRAEGYHRIEANYRLLNDNLLDLSHETYVHTRTIGHEAVAESPIAIKVDEAPFASTRRCPAARRRRSTSSSAASGDRCRIDRWQRTVYQPPGYIVIDVGVQALEPVPGSNRVEGRVINLMTPETATSTHYFWAFARNFRLDEPGVTEYLRANVGRTFDEDKDMLEAQQRNLGERGRARVPRSRSRPMPGRRRAGGLLASLIEAESRGA